MHQIVFYLFQVGEGSSSYQPILLTSDHGLDVVEEEVTTEIIKTEIQTDDDCDQFLVKSETVDYEDDHISIKKHVSKVIIAIRICKTID